MKVTKLDILGAAVLGAVIGSMFALFIQGEDDDFPAFSR